MASKPLNLKLKKNVFNPKFYPMLFDYSNRWEVYKGSAGSGKSHFIAQKILIKSLNDSNRRVLICRRWGTTIRETVWQLMIDTIRFFKIESMCKINKTERTIVLPNESTLIFFGLDDETKLLSLQDISDIWVEEAFEVPKDIVEQLNLRMRSKRANQQIFMSFNPISASHWLYDFCEVNQPKSFMYHQSTFRDNKFLPQSYIEALEDMYRTNPKKAKVFCDGEWGVDTEGIVYPNHRVDSFDINELLRDMKLTVMCGADMGFTDPSTCVVSLWDKENKKIYVISEYYQRGASFEELAEGIKGCGVNKNKVFIDNADPRAIKYFAEHGINAKACKKGKDSNKLYMSFLQDHEIIVHESCKNIAMELDNFSFVKDKVTGLYNQDRTTHEWSHAIDALKYSYSDVYRSNKLNTWKLDLGL